MNGAAFSLLSHRWIPVLRASGARETIRPNEITSRMADDPVDAIAWGRADLDAATREFLIGLLATACRIDARDRWREWFKIPPTPEELAAAFTPLVPAFLLDGPGPRFRQDLDSLERRAACQSRNSSSRRRAAIRLRKSRPFRPPRRRRGALAFGGRDCPPLPADSTRLPAAPDTAPRFAAADR